jgi:hypothetical protein
MTIIWLRTLKDSEHSNNSRPVADEADHGALHGIRPIRRPRNGKDIGAKILIIMATGITRIINMGIMIQDIMTLTIEKEVMMNLSLRMIPLIENRTRNKIREKLPQKQVATMMMVNSWKRSVT